MASTFSGQQPAYGNPLGPVVDLAVPPSKSQLQRVLIASAWSGRPVLLQRVDLSKGWSAVGSDVGELTSLLETTGWQTAPAGRNTYELRSPGWSPMGAVQWQLGESGTSARLLLAALAFAGQPGSERTLDVAGTLRARGSDPLLASLRAAGVAWQQPGGRLWPVQLRSIAAPRSFVLEHPASSQEVSALLFPLAMQAGGVLEVRGTIPSRPYVGTTRAVLEAFGASVREQRQRQEGFEHTRFEVEPIPTTVDARQDPVQVRVEPDASAAAVAWAAGLMAGIPVRVGAWPDDPSQGDAAFPLQLQWAGAQVRRDAAQGLVVSGEITRGVDWDLQAMPDLAPVWAALAAAKAGGFWGERQPSVLRGLGALERKESPRLSGLCALLQNLGLPAQHGRDWLSIPVGELRAPAQPWSASGDHRMAFALALLQWACPQLAIQDPQCVAKSWPGFWKAIERLRAASRA